MTDNGICQKDNRKIPIDAGCIHPNDYCKYRQSCLIHFFEQERKRESKKKQDKKNR